jgi:hypothetical protein
MFSVTHNSHFNKRLCLQKTVTSDAHTLLLFYYALKLWYFAVREFFHSSSSAFVQFVQFTNPSYGDDFTSWCSVICSSFNTLAATSSQCIRRTAYHAAVAWTDIRTPLHEFTLNYFVLGGTHCILLQKPTSWTTVNRYCAGVFFETGLLYPQLV